MSQFKYLIIGGGMTADAAVEGIRDLDASGAIGLIGAEPDAPYNRPPLSKGLWKGEAVDSIWRKNIDRGVALNLGRKAVALDPRTKTVTDDRGAAYQYEKLLLATGASPRRLPFDKSSSTDPGASSGTSPVIYYRTLRDYKSLHALTARKRRFAVIGGGFIGWEVAAALVMNGREVVMFFPEETIGARIYPAELGRFLNQFYTEKGARVIARSQVVGLDKVGEATRIHTQNHGDFEVDAVVAGVGVLPETALAQAAGLAIDNGIVVDEFLRTSEPHIYAAGDVANFPNPVLGRRMRVEHEDNANSMGRAAGRCMAGAAEGYTHLPFFYSDLFDQGYEAVGELDPRLEIVTDWKEPNREGVIYYMREGRVRGVLLWNIFGQVEEATRLIAAPGPFRAAELKGRLPRAA